MLPIAPRIVAILSLLVVLMPTADTRAAESWADARLPVRDGLIGWYDASVQNAARQSQGQNQWKEDSRVDVWRDGSGAQRDLTQVDKEQRPKIHFDGDLALVGFNGEMTVLGAEGLELVLKETTVFVVGTAFSNDGNFRALLAFNRNGQNDYVSGLNLDQGPDGSREWVTLNAEGAGFGGAWNLKQNATPFGRLVRVCLVSTAGTAGTALYVNGKPEGRRDRAAGELSLDRLTVGARFYNHGGPPQATGHWRGEIAEALIFDRRLADDEIRQVDDYLTAKYEALPTRPIPLDLLAARPVPRVADPPPVQMLAPGFTARKLPLELSNVNNLRYRPDGKLMALTYDGRLLLLSDSDGDGLEDQADVFWDQGGFTVPIGMALTPTDYARGDGAVVASRAQIVLIVDKDGDDRGDELIVVADGWEPIKQTTDALGVAFAPDGSVYYGLGTGDFTNAYRLDEKGTSHYEVGAQRGAIVRVSPDFKTRELVCSGIRFPVGIAFNRTGDLFCTDQEGATWLPNGNPFDELLHIQTGRHYGFPPRHPKHLPGVIDEPSVFDFTPQHQSTCGLFFNIPVTRGGKTFGPEWWQDNAIACGYSRGKLYRTTLARTLHGYVAQGDVLASLNMLTIDAALSPTGDLAVTVHSGGPDWGSGPSGKGTLYKISYTGREEPQPVKAWAASPHEVRVAFDRPLSDEHFERYRDAVIEVGAFVRAGDRFEAFWPGYAIVDGQNRATRRLVPVLGANLTADRRSMLLATGAQRDAIAYAVLFGSKRPLAEASQGTLPQFPAVELSYDLTGIAAEWTAADGKSSWQGWLPHVDLAAAMELLASSAEREQLQQALASPGKLTLRTQLDLSFMLRPRVQPGSKLDYEYAPEDVTVELAAPVAFSVTAGANTLGSQEANGRHQVRLTFADPGSRWQPIEVVIPTGSVGPQLNASWHTAEDARSRAFAPRRFLLPWAAPAGAELPPVQAEPLLAGGDWHRGRELFYSEQAQCGKCHAVRGRGGWIGPDLSNLVHRDYTSVRRDIEQPSFAINPDHQAFNLVLDDGRVLSGTIRPQGEELLVGDAKGIETRVPRASVDEMQSAKLSIMPEGLPTTIGADGMRDLLTFLLLSEPGVLEPAPLERDGAPAQRTRAEIGEILRATQPVDAAQLKPLKILLVAGPKDHGPGEHDYPAWQKRWGRLLASADKVEVATADVWPTAEQWAAADIVVMFSANPAWTPEHAQDLDNYFARGGGLVLLHFAVNGQRAPEEYARRIGLAWGPGAKFRHGELSLDFTLASQNPITTGFTRLDLIDESYWDLMGDASKINVLATQVEAGKPRPLLWTYEPGKGRVFVSILGHYNWTFDDPLFRLLVLRGMAWTADQPVDRFNALIMPGARISD